MPRVNIRDILKRGAKLEVRKISTKELNNFLKKNPFDWGEYYRAVEMRKQGTWEMWHTPITI